MALSTLARPVDSPIDAGRYPVHRPRSSGYRAVVERARAALAADGCCVLPGFVAASHEQRLREQGRAVAPHAHRTAGTVTVYNTRPDPTLPDGHPGRRTFERGNAFVPRDEIPAEHLIHRLYLDADFQALLADCFELPGLFPLADPLSGVCLNVLEPGRAHPWHFDVNEFTVTVLTQDADAGGTFEFCPGIRAPGRENLDGVEAVLSGRDHETVRQLTLRPRDLQLFRGRYALHRVTEVTGTQARHTAILAYSETPGLVGSPERARQLFGRVLPAHTENRDHGPDVDDLLS